MAMQGFKTGGALQQAQQQAQIGQQEYMINQMKVDEYQKAQAKQREFQTAVAGLGRNPKAQDYLGLMVRFPSMAEALKAPYEALNADQKQAKLTQATQVLAALNANSPETAISLLGKIQEAATNAGDNAGAAGAKALIDQINLDPLAARDAAALSVAAASGADQFASIYEKISKVGAEAALQPGLIAKQDFELIQLGTNMGIDPKKTQEIINSYRGAKLTQETSANLLALQAGSPSGRIFDPEKRYQAAKDLRTEFNKRIGDVTSGKVSYEKMLASAEVKEGLGDVALITSFMKMLDPGSVVRETEFATARDTAGLFVSLENALKKAQTGEFLSPGQRSTFVALAKQYLSAAEKDGAKTRKSMEGIVNRLGLNPADVFVDVVEEAPAAFPEITTQEQYDALPSGSVYMENGQQYRKP